MKTIIKIIGYLLALVLLSSFLGSLIATLLSEDRVNVIIQLTLICIGLMIIPVVLLYFIFRIPSKLYKDRYYYKDNTLDINIESRGVGSTFFDKSDIAQDGSFITTKWISLIYFPVIPLQRFRIQILESKGTLIYKKIKYKIIETLPLDRVAIAKHYRKFYLVLLPLLIVPAMILGLLPSSNASYEIRPYMGALAIGYVCWVCIVLIIFIIFHLKNIPD